MRILLSESLATEQVIHQELYFNDSFLLTAGKIVHNKSGMVRVDASITLLSSYSKLTAAAFVQVKTFHLVQSVKGALTPPKFLMILL